MGWKNFLIAVTLLSIVWNLEGTMAGVRLATADDVAVMQGVTDPATALSNRFFDFRIGRIYAGQKLWLLESLIKIPSDHLLAVARLALFFTAAAGAVWFVWEWTHSRDTALLVLAVAAGWLQISVSYQPLLSNPTLWLGWGAIWIMGALTLRPESAFTHAAIVAAFAVALTVHEGNAAFVLWPSLLRLARDGRQAWRPAMKDGASCVALLGAYGVLCLALRQAAVDCGPLYSGAKLSCNLREFGFALLVYSLSGVPGLEPWLAREARQGSVVLSPAEWADRISRWTAPSDWVVAVLLGLTVWVCVGATASSRRGPPRNESLLFAGVIFAAFAPNLLLASTGKYQGWAHQRMWPYYYSSMSFLVWVVVMVVGVRRVACQLGGGGWNRRVRVAVAIAAAVTAGTIYATSRQAVAKLHRQPFTHSLQERE